MITQKKQIKKITSTDKSLVHASNYISFQITRTKIPYTIGEELVKLCILTAAEDILSPKTAKKFEGIPLSNDTVKRRIENMEKDVEQQVIEEVKKSLYYAIQLDESTNVSYCALLLCFVRYKGIADFKEELLCSINLPGRAAASEIFPLLDEYFCENKIDWGNCVA